MRAGSGAELTAAPGELGRPWSRPAVEVAAALGVDPAVGLDDGEVEERRRRHGDNAPREKARRGLFSLLVAQLRSFVVLLLAAGAGLSFAFAQIAEGAAIAAVIAINTAIGFFTELRAVRSMEALRRLGEVYSTARRAGELRRVSARELVPGDVVLLEAGDVVTADLRLLSASRLQLDESSLTGESVPVGKQPDPVAGDAPLAERRSMLFKGTAVTRGGAEAVVVATGMETELGRITELVAASPDRATPLEERIEKLGRALAWASLGFVAVVAGVGIAGGKDPLFVVETAIALAVATVPEGLPIVATIALARGMWRMARRNAVIEQLAAVETLGSTSVILTDKTGTLTENRMAVDRVEVDGDRETELLRVAALCTTAEPGRVGDPMELALLEAARRAGIERTDLLAEHPLETVDAFDPEIKMMATQHREGDAILVAVKGAPEAVLAACTRAAGASDPRPFDAAERERWRRRAEGMAADGLRVLAIAERRSSGPGAAPDPYRDLTLLGLVGLLDPPRDDVAPAIAACQGAGIRVVMVTGDHAATALNIGRAVGLAGPGDAAVSGAELESEDDPGRLLAAPVIARASPEQKLRLLDLYQGAGEVVAMLGDGVNDAPALRRADIGVAMGERGTQVAREAAAMVLRDDRFASVTAAIEQGRVIFGNIRTFVVYLVSCNMSEILTVGVAALVGAPLPILPLQILFLNLITDVFPALALGVGEGPENVMQKSPRPRSEPFLTWHQWVWITGSSVVLAAPVLAGLAAALLWLELPVSQAVTISFLILALAQLVHVFNMADPRAGLVVNEVTRNRWVWAALLLCLLLIAAGLSLPGLSDVLQLETPGRAGWLLVAGLTAVPLVVGQAIRMVLRSARSARHVARDEMAARSSAL